MVHTHNSKMTVLGVLPVDWEVSNIQDCFQKNENIKIGPFGSQLKKEYLLPRGDYYVYGQENVYQDDFHICYRFLSFQRFNSLKSCEIRPGDFVVSTMGTIGKCAVVPDYAHTGIMDSHLVRMRFNDSINKSFFAYLFRSRVIQDQIRKLSVGGIMEGLSTSILKKINVILPPIQEQKRIAGALLSVDKMIGALDKAIAKKRQIKEGLMQQLLTGKTRLPGFKGEWTTVSLGSISQMYQPQTITQDSLTISGYPVYGANGIIGKYPYYNHITDQVMVTCRGSSCGTVNYSVGYCWITGNAMVVNMDGYHVNKRFIYYVLDRADLTSLITGSGQPQIVRTPLQRLEIFIPKSVEEQTAIAESLDSIERDIISIESKRKKYSLIKQGMMQELLTGKTRL